MNKPPFDLTPKILSTLAQIYEALGELKGQVLASKPSPKLRKDNRIKTVHHSLAIEGNELDESQVTAILENRQVLGPRKQIIEVQNALNVYEKLSDLNAMAEKDFLKVHRLLMEDLVVNPGKYRASAVGIMKGSKVSRMAPPAKLVPSLMGNLFTFLRKDAETPVLIKACVFHYELELIHPFADGNGRMGRLWQQRILMEYSPIFEYLAVETWIHQAQKSYYQALEKSDLAGKSTLFIEFSLSLIAKELELFKSQFRPSRAKASDRLEMALQHFGSRTFSRKTYQALFRDISAPTASRDLARAVAEKKISMAGAKATATYKKRKSESGKP